MRAFKRAASNEWRDRELIEVALDGATHVVSRDTLRGGIRPLNDTLAVVNNGKSLTLRNLRTGVDRALYTGSVWDRGYSLSADGKSISASVNFDGIDAPALIDAATGAARRIPYALGGEIAEVLFHPDGKQLVAYSCPTCIDGKYVEKWDVVLVPLNGDPAKVLTAKQANYKDHGWPSIAADGRSIAIVGEVSYNTRIVNITVPSRP